MSKTALIAGVTGQDGSYLAHYLLGRGYRVVGTTRDLDAADLFRLKRLEILSHVELVSLVPSQISMVHKCVSEVMPNEIYNLAGQTSVGLSFKQPAECMESICTTTLNFLEVIRSLGGNIRFFSAGSSECFGSTGQTPATEYTSLNPCSPYAVAKAMSYWLVKTYRQSYGLFACTGILANHESPLRSRQFVTQKIIQGIKKIKEGELDKLTLNNLDVWRDWGWAPDYVQAMPKMIQRDCPEDFIIASGSTISLRQFTYAAFNTAGLNPDDYIEISDTLKRPNDISYSAVSPARIKNDIGWHSSRGIDEIVFKMYHDCLF